MKQIETSMSQKAMIKTVARTGRESLINVDNIKLYDEERNTEAGAEK